VCGSRQRGEVRVSGWHIRQRVRPVPRWSLLPQQLVTVRVPGGRVLRGGEQHVDGVCRAVELPLGQWRHTESNAIANVKSHARTDGGAVIVADTEPDAIAHAKPNAIANSIANAVSNTQPHAACRSLQPFYWLRSGLFLPHRCSP
jgi:hypothetical protein